jgi:pilus assembly protein CpaB
MWKVKRMNTAPMIVLTIARGAGGIAAHPADGSDNTPGPAKVVARSQIADFAKSAIGSGHAVKPQRTPA